MKRNALNLLPFFILLVLSSFILQTDSRTLVVQTTPYTARSQETGAHYPLLPASRVQNVILFIGDGMGMNQVTASRIKMLGAGTRLHMERMPVTGLLTTDCEDSLITDSGAAATALATGQKVPYRSISMNRRREALRTILEAAREKGMATGLVTTTEIVDATPAAFGAHVAHRDSHNVIAKQLVESGIDILMGGGKKHFIPRSHPGSERTDELNLIEHARLLGFNYVETADQLAKVHTGKLLALFSTEQLMAEPPKPSVGEMTSRAIELLRKHKGGFFLMVETERTDEEGHANNFDKLARALLDFDEAVRRALEFAFHNRKTIVLVTADHETGGLQLEKGGPVTQRLQVSWSTTKHTGQPVPLFAFGPNAIRFTGVQDNTDMPKHIASLLALKGFPAVCTSH
jgi:alkaline phosphatase